MASAFHHYFPVPAIKLTTRTCHMVSTQALTTTKIKQYFPCFCRWMQSQNQHVSFEILSPSNKVWQILTAQLVRAPVKRIGVLGSIPSEAPPPRRSSGLTPRGSYLTMCPPSTQGPNCRFVRSRNRGVLSGMILSVLHGVSWSHHGLGGVWRQKDLRFCAG